MDFTVSIQEEHYTSLLKHLFVDRKIERAAYLFCSISRSDTEIRLLVQDVVPVGEDEIERASATDIVIKQFSYLRALKLAARNRKCFVLVHSHPEGYPIHSTQDDREETKLFRTAYIRIHDSDVVHASIVISRPDFPRGRVWLPDGAKEIVSRIRVIGKSFAIFDTDNEEQIDISAFDRQVLAFGSGIQRLFRKLHVGIVGYGGTGSAIFEQLVRLGIGKITVCDPQLFEATNVNRVYGSRKADETVSKVEIAQRLARDINIPTDIEPLSGAATDLPVATKLKKCEILFGCTDDESGRSILTRMAAYYLIPVFDMGVKIDSEGGKIRSVRGRVTTLLPGAPCLFCRGTITADGIAAEILYKNNPEEYKDRRKDGYVPELPGTAPAVIMFTSAVASTAICEMLHRFTGYMGLDRQSTEIILRFDESKISTNSRAADAACWCSSASSWGAGDTDPFLELTWPA